MSACTSCSNTTSAPSACCAPRHGSRRVTAIAGGASIATDAEGLALLRSAPSDPAVAYFRDTLRVRYLLDRKHVTVDQLFAERFDTARLDREAAAFYTR
jgi:hypothetical protein